MSFNLDFPILQSWRGTLANWQQKLKLIANAASIGAALATPQLNWNPEVLQFGAASFTADPNRNVGWYVQIPGTPIIMFQGQVQFTVTGALGTDTTFYVSLPTQSDMSHPDITLDFNQVFASRFTEAGSVTTVHAVAAIFNNPRGLGAVVVQKPAAGAFLNGTHNFRYGGIYRSINQL